MLSLISSAIATHLSLIFTAALSTHHKFCTGISSPASQNSCQLAPGLMSHSHTPPCPGKVRQGTPPPTMCTERLPSGGGKGGGGGGAAAAFILISFRRCPALPCLPLLASPSSSLRAHQGHDNMHSHAEGAQQVAWKTYFRDILPDVCI